jgi:hypothetical protein
MVIGISSGTGEHMPKMVASIGLLIVLLALSACTERPPEVEWELSIDGDVNQPVTYTFQDLVDMRRTKLTDIPTRNPDNPDETTSWEGVTLFLLFQEPGGVEYTVNSWALITLVDGTTWRANMSELRGALIALKNGEGNWLAETTDTPLRLIAPNLPTKAWLDSPVRITVHGP